MTETVIDEVVNEEMRVYNIDVADIYPDEQFNCRGYISPSDCVDLAKEIDQHTLLQPITIQPWVMVEGKKYRIIQGHRRFTAISQVLKWDKIPAMIKRGLSDTDALILNLGENLQRKALDIMQEAKALERMKKAGMSQKDVAEALRMQRPWVQTRFYVLDFPPDIQEEIRNGTLTQHQIHEIHCLSPEQWYPAVREIKDARARANGKKIAASVKKFAKPKAENLIKVKIRKPDEILVLLDHMMDTGEPGLHTRVLAWAVGQISTFDLLTDFKKHNEENGIPYHIPADGIAGL